MPYDVAKMRAEILRRIEEAEDPEGKNRPSLPPEDPEIVAILEALSKDGAENAHTRLRPRLHNDTPMAGNSPRSGSRLAIHFSIERPHHLQPIYRPQQLNRSHRPKYLTVPQKLNSNHSPLHLNATHDPRRPGCSGVITTRTFAGLDNATFDNEATNVTRASHRVVEHPYVNAARKARAPLQHIRQLDTQPREISSLFRVRAAAAPVLSRAYTISDDSSSKSDDLDEEPYDPAQSWYAKHKDEPHDKHKRRISWSAENRHSIPRKRRPLYPKKATIPPPKI
ncbi:hypothetical protein BJ878DRAFT_510001, partial [Calycina marina]